MTRFYTTQSSAKVWRKLRHVMKALEYDARTSADEVSATASEILERGRLTLLIIALGLSTVLPA